MSGPQARARLLLVTSSLVVAASCASSPRFVPGGGMAEGTIVEAGVGSAGTGAVSLDGVGAEGTTWARASFGSRFDLYATAHGGAALAGRASRAGVSDIGPGPWTFGGGLGARVRYPFLNDDLWVGFGIEGAYRQRGRTLTTTGGLLEERFLEAKAMFPVAERVWEDLWVYTTPTVGLGVPVLVPEDQVTKLPYAGIVESPTGLAWRLHPNVTLLAEGGWSLALSGPYAAGAVAVTY